MRRRNAFTIVELLVAMALIMFIMSILSTAFVTATTLFRNLKAVGDMANKLRSVTTLLQRDLAADHFEGKKRLSDPTFWVNGPPTQGFFRVWQGSKPGAGLDFNEGVDLDGFASYRSVDHMLAFTVKLRGVQMGEFMTAGPHGGGAVLGNVAAFGPPEARYQLYNSTTKQYTTYNYQWAEVAWFLQPQYDPNNPTVQDSTSGGIPLYTLYRNQRLAVPDNNLVQPAQPATLPSSFLETSCWTNGTNWYFNSPMDLTMPYRRFGMSRSSPAGVPTQTAVSNGITYPTYPTLAQKGAPGNLVNADIQATDVVSFDVRLLVLNLRGKVDPFVTLFHIANGGYWNGNPSFNATSGPVVFDTWSSLSDTLSGYPGYSAWNTNANPHHSIPLWNPTLQTGPIIQAIQITIRVWDMKTEQTREVTIVQAM